MSATIKDICKKTGFSTATVSRVLNDSPLVTEETKEKVRAALDRMGYQPHHAARSLKLNRTGMIAVVFPDLDNGFFTDVLRGVDEMASEFGVHLLTAFTHGAQDEQELITRMARERRADALILMNLTNDDAFLIKLKTWKIPIILIDRPLKSGGMISVGIDNRGGAAAMTKHLIEQGHRSIVFVAGPEKTYDSDERLVAFRRTMKQHKRAVPASSIWRGDFTEASGTRLMEEQLRENRPLPDAIFAGNDAMAVGIHSVLRFRGLGVPRDVALVGFDDADLARHLDLTTVHVPMRQIGREAARQALAVIEGKPSRKPVVLPTRLVIRGSCVHSVSTSRRA
jgi:LacI family transcriptional regulator